MQKHTSKLLAVTLIAFIMIACAGATPTPNVNTIMTAAVSTMVASFFDTQTAMVTPVTPTSIPTATLTLTSFPTFTPFSSPTIFASRTFIYYTSTLGTLTPGTPTATGTRGTATINPSVLAFGCNNLAFIRDVTVPAGTVIQKNQDFTKTWKVQNTGTCNWLYQYGLVLLSGNPYGGKNTKIQKLVTVNDWSEVSVNMTAPKDPGTYTNYWRMTDASGHMFGSTLAASFVVAAPPAPTSAPTFTKTPAPVPTFTFTPAPTSTDTETPTP